MDWLILAEIFLHGGINYCLVVGRRNRMDDVANQMRGQSQHDVPGLRIVSYDRLVDGERQMDISSGNIFLFRLERYIVIRLLSSWRKGLRRVFEQIAVLLNEKVDTKLNS